MATLRPRSFTIGEQRSITFERVALYVVFMVSLIAAVISFVALTWFGSEQMGMGPVAPLMPLAIDGFAIGCSVGIIRSQASGERARARASEWIGLFLALGLSIAGNVQHALIQGAQSAPRAMVIAYGAAIPIIVAYGIHVYGRAMATGVSAHVLVDARDKLQFDLARLGEQCAPRARTTSAQRAPQPRTERSPAAQSSAQPSGERARMKARFEQARASGEQVSAAALHTEVGAQCSRATTRRWVAGWQAELENAQQHDRPLQSVNRA